MNASFFFLAEEGRARGEGSGREVPILLVLVGEPRLEQTIKLIILCLFLLRKAPVRSTSFPGSLLARPRAGKMSDPRNEVAVRSRIHHDRVIWKHSSWHTVHSNPTRKPARFANALQTVGVWTHRLCVFVWTEKILKTELIKNNDVTIITWFLWPSFPQIQI